MRLVKFEGEVKPYWINPDSVVAVYPELDRNQQPTGKAIIYTQQPGLCLCVNYTPGYVVDALMGTED